MRGMIATAGLGDCDQLRLPVSIRHNRSGGFGHNLAPQKAEKHMSLQRSSMLVAAGWAATALALAGVRAQAPPADGDYFVYVGSYTDAPSQSKGVYAWRFSPGSGAVAPLGLVAETVNPAYVHASPDSKFLFAT